MNCIDFQKMKSIKKILSLGLSAAIAVMSIGLRAAASSEAAEAIYSGIGNSDAIIRNISYTDVINSNSWAKEAIFETGAFGILKGYGDRRFGLKDFITKEQAIAMIYRAAGRESDAQKASEAIELARSEKEKKKNPVSAWADGYLQLAAADGLITWQDLNDAFNPQQMSLEAESFHRDAPAERQEMAYWLAKVLKLSPVYSQQKIFNNYRDWKSADAEKVPYIEAVLDNNIMNGDGNGSFRPKDPLTKEQAAQVMKNAQNFILPLLGFTKRTGTIENIENINDVSHGFSIARLAYDIRNSSGALHKILTEMPLKSSLSGKNENTGGYVQQGVKDLVVYKNGNVGDSSLLKEGDRIEYITGKDNTVKFVKVISSIHTTRYIAAQIMSIDLENRLMDVLEYFNVNYPDMELSKESLSFDAKSQKLNSIYRYSSSAAVLIDGRISKIQNLKPGSDAILTVQNDVVTEIATFEFARDRETNVVKGIVEDNNPQLGYITLYGEDGTGTAPGSQQLYVLRTYNYGNQNNIEVFKNHKTAEIEDIKTGDTVFLKLDENYNVIAISAVDNYIVKYAKIISKKPSSLVVEYNSGEQQVLDIDEDVFVIAGKKPAEYTRIKDGDRVRLLLHVTNKFTRVKEISIESGEHYISAIYKARIESIDSMSERLVAQNLKVFENGRWVKTEQKGAVSFRLNDECMMYFDDRKLDIDRANKYFRGNEAYIAVIKDYGDEEKAVFITYRNEEDAEDEPYEDSVSLAMTGAGIFKLSKRTDAIKYGKGTIIIKEGRLVTGSSISEEDIAYVVANRSYDSGEYYAGIIKIDSRYDSGLLQIYRGRIKSIDENSSFTVESFSQLKGLAWEFANTPKTFKVGNNTRIIDDGGVVNQRDFKDYGDGSFKNRTVYVVADGAEVLLVSTAPYGIQNIKGEVFEITGGSIGEEGTQLEEPTGFKITDAKIYNLSDYMWKESKDMDLNLLKSSIIVRGSEVIKPSDLKPGDRVRVIRKDDSEAGDAYIVIVEN